LCPTAPWKLMRGHGEWPPGKVSDVLWKERLNFFTASGQLTGWVVPGPGLHQAYFDHEVALLPSQLSQTVSHELQELLRLGMIGQKKFAILEWVILLGLTACPIAPSEVIGLKPLWKDSAIHPIVVPAETVTALRPAWGRRSYWSSLAFIFAGHTTVLLVVLQALPPRRLGIPQLLLVPIGSNESAFIGGMFWKRMKAWRTSGPRL
jgi:hypothetical protein